MFIALDNITGELVVSYNLRNENYKKSYNKSLRYSCIGDDINCLKKCNDNNICFVNNIKKTPHFRHSSKRDCSSNRTFIEFNTSFYKLWYDCFKNEFIKPYWFNVDLKDIQKDNQKILFRYSPQSKSVIENFERSIENTKIDWILSLETRKYNKILHHKGKFYIDFRGFKNDIPIYNVDKSTIYLDTGEDVLLKVKLNSYCFVGQEIELVELKHFLNDYDDILLYYPLKSKWVLKEALLKEQADYFEEQEKARLKQIEEEEKARLKKIEDDEKARLKKEEDDEKARLKKIEDDEKDKIITEKDREEILRLEKCINNVLSNITKMKVKMISKHNMNDGKCDICNSIEVIKKCNLCNMKLCEVCDYDKCKICKKFNFDIRYDIVRNKNKLFVAKKVLVKKSIFVKYQ